MSGSPDNVYPAFPQPAAIFTQEGPDGVRFDFNRGCRVKLAGDTPRRIILRDLDTNNVLIRTDEFTDGVLTSSKKFYVRFGIEVYQGDTCTFSHDYSCEGKNVLIAFPVGTLGDVIAWFPYAVKFQRKHNCHLTCAMADWITPLFQESHPEITFVTHDHVQADQFYASYYIGLYFSDPDHLWQPMDFRLVGLHRTAGYILGVDPEEETPVIALDDNDEGPPIPDPYVCIAVQASTHAKKWTHPQGWLGLVRFLKQHGYRVVCIDREAEHGNDIVRTTIPHGSEDETGPRPLLERARWLRHAAFFVGSSSGLAWLAWAVNTPVVLISGFTLPMNEFYTPYRVINYHGCHSCWNDVRHTFEHTNYLWCPRHADTARQFECGRVITLEQVTRTIERIPGFGLDSGKRVLTASTARTSAISEASRERVW